MLTRLIKEAVEQALDELKAKVPDHFRSKHELKVNLFPHDMMYVFSVPIGHIDVSNDWNRRLRLLCYNCGGIGFSLRFGGLLQGIPYDGSVRNVTWYG